MQKPKSSNPDLPGKQNQQKPLRLLPGIIIVILMILIKYLIPFIITSDSATQIGVLSGPVGGLAVIVWWLFFSRAARMERWLALVLIIIALFATSKFLHESIATAMMGMMFTFYSIPVLSLAFVAWALLTNKMSDRFRRTTMIFTIFIASGFWTLIRTDGMKADTSQDFAWRWAETAEERLLARAGDETNTLSLTKDVKESGVHWPGFRGPDRDGVIHGIQFGTDWSVKPPVQMWRRPVGPGCSSFAVHGDLLYTQEQRGEFEIVSCYNLVTGEPVWKHQDSARFWDAHAGAGPRATPTLNNGFAYTFGATGILNALNASNGSVVWSRNPANDHKVKTPGWGFASSPLVVGDLVIVAVEGVLAAYDIATGFPRWSGHDGGPSYSSPHLLTIDGIVQVLLLSSEGATSFAPADGTILWKYSWPGGCRIVQPGLMNDSNILVCGGDGNGIRKISVSHESREWKVEEKWLSGYVRPNFNDFVVHKGYAYGYNGTSLACIDLKDGKSKWKEGRYGGQILLLADQDMLLVMSESGELALVRATPDKFTELANFRAIEGRTWNHPVLVGDILLVRNSLEMAAFRLAPDGLN